ncbi:unnamed protein product [Adineta ricciae]|uniref:Uncharacterized protein n=1 Tax=Adineta ricciae TaxID=249248 RepID=A0A814DRS8_ADIRI|nr:unnamed protein product [Adineta ricciae]CAF1272370.1 unnamed protein product [Adineta ricciae]
MRENWVDIYATSAGSVNFNSISNNRLKWFQERRTRWLILFGIVLTFVLTSIIVPITIALTKKNTTLQTTATSATQVASTVSTTMQVSNIPKWKGNGITIVGGNEYNSTSNRLSDPMGLCIDDDRKSIYIADQSNHRIVEYKFNGTQGEVVAGGNQPGSRLDQLNVPKDVVIDKKHDSLIICDYANARVVRWSRQNQSHQELILSDVRCYGLAIDRDGDLYICDWGRSKVIRWKEENRNVTVVAGGHGYGKDLNQLAGPSYIFVDGKFSVFVSDTSNNRIMKWSQNSEAGIVVAGGRGQGNNLTQLSAPMGIFVDDLGNMYIADSGNIRIMYWAVDTKEGTILISQYGNGEYPIQFVNPTSISFDSKNNLYVSDTGAHRVRKFKIDRN